MSDIHKAIEAYLNKNWAILPLGERKKEPFKGYKWKENSINKDTISNVSSTANIGIALGQRSNGLVDIDFDMAEAAQIGNLLFAELPAFGRKSAPNNHRFVKCIESVKTKQFQLNDDEAKALGLEKSVIIELRTDGAYTMVPPSTHPCGEVLSWSSSPGDHIPQKSWEDLENLARLCAFLAIVLKRYPTVSGKRDQICMALAGSLIRTGLSTEMTDNLVTSIARLKDDEEADMRTKAEITKEKLDNGEEITGLPKLCELLDIKVVEKTLHKWLYKKAQNFSSDQIIEKLNAQYFVVNNEGGKCCVASWEDQPDAGGGYRKVLTTTSFSDFKKIHMNKKVTVGHTEKGAPIIKPIGDYWLEHEQRRQYLRIDFSPGETTPENVYNLWQGFKCKPVKGSWRHMRRHIWFNIAQQDREIFRYILKWVAWAVQHPNRPAEVALVLKGNKGTGKGTFARAIKNLFGQHGLQIFSSSHLTGHFNAHLRDCVLLYADEAIAPGNHEAEANLKGILTEPIIPIERKGHDIIQVPNYLHVIMTSNSEWVVPATSDERRFAVIQAADKIKVTRCDFDQIYYELDHGGMEAMLHFFLNLDLGDWHPRKDIPANDALTEQRIQTLKGPERMWFDCLSEAEIPQDIMGPDNIIETSKFAILTGSTLTKAGRFLSDMGCTRTTTRPRGWSPPPLSEARQIWNKEQFKCTWDSPADWPWDQAIPF